MRVQPRKVTRAKSPLSSSRVEDGPTSISKRERLPTKSRAIIVAKVEIVAHPRESLLRHCVDQGRFQRFSPRQALKNAFLEKSSETLIRLPECPICHKPVAPVTDPTSNYAPFCSRRCKEVDLVRWCEGRYAIVETIDPTRRQEESPDRQESELENDLFSEETE